jgi:dGTPase
VHAHAFRRLEDKTQVFGDRLSDHFRNRLTHTIEVSQIARTLASALGLNEDFTEALALAHDIGHPPFAHAGEEALDREMRIFHDGFDHNLHALRIVESFEQRYARFPGLNLTFEVREGMVKHSRDFARGESAELDEYLPGWKPPLEAQLIDPADEVAYNTADLDDGFSAGLFELAEIAAEVPHYGELLANCQARFSGAPHATLFHEVLRRLIDRLVSSLIEGTIDAVAGSGVKSVEDVRLAPDRLVRMRPEEQETNAALKRFLFVRVYSSDALVQERQRASQAIARLFSFYMGHPEQLPEAHRERIASLAVHRVVCDYIAGMTDGFFRRTERRLFGC